MQWVVRKTSTQNFDLYISQGFEQRERNKKNNVNKLRNQAMLINKLTKFVFVIAFEGGRFYVCLSMI